MKNHKKDEDIKEMQKTAGEEETPVEALEPEIVEEEDALTPLEEKQKQYNELLDKYQRSLADFDNFRKRTIKEKASMYDDGIRNVLSALLPVVDNLERALAAADADTAQKEEGLYKGVDMIKRQLNGIFDELGLVAIDAKGELFDHNLHHAVAHVEDESFGENEVIEEMQKGYMYKDKVIRPSMVKVAN